MVAQKTNVILYFVKGWVPHKLMFEVLSPHLVALFTEAVEFLRGGALLKEVYY